MKRPTFQISVNGKPATVRHAWNAARAATRQVLRDALIVRERAELYESTYAKSEEGYHTGVELWRTTYGRKILINIDRVQHAN